MGDTQADVALTNVGLTISLMAIVFVTTVFNQTLSENQNAIEAGLSRMMAPLRPVQSWLQRLSERRTLMRDAGWLAFVLTLTVVIYGFLEPGFGLNTRSLVVVSSLLVTGVAITYLSEGFEAWLARRRYGQTTGVRIFPLAALIAVACVALSRLTGFLPGVVYGFVGTAVYLHPSTLDDDETAKTVYAPALLLLGLSVLSWLAVTPLRDWSAGSNSLAPAFLEGAAVGVFIGGLEGLFFNMLPFKFMDGEKILRWNRLAWVLLFGAATFLFWEVLLNDQRAYFGALKETTTQIALILGVSCLILTVLLWTYFKLTTGAAGTGLLIETPDEPPMLSSGD